jgi:dipeptidyl aminopeptidase/acylaminoacyl peptidase
MNKIAAFIFAFLPFFVIAQNKKVITHADYDQWESVGERYISNNGNFVVFTVNPQEGDGRLEIKTLNGKTIKVVPRGYNATISNDEKFVFFKIKPLFKDTRDAKIKKKKPDEMPKDSLAIYEIATDSLQKIPKVKSFKTSEKGNGWLAYYLEKAAPEKPKPAAVPDSVTQIKNMVNMADSLHKLADSMIIKANLAKTQGLKTLLPTPKPETKAAPKAPEEPIEEGTDLVVRNLETKKEITHKLVNEYYFDKYGKALIIETSKKNGDAKKQATILWQNLATQKVDTVLKNFNDAKNYAIDEKAEQLAFVAERDSSTKALQKFYKLYHYYAGSDSAKLLVSNKLIDSTKKLTVSPDYINNFSKDGAKLFFGLAPIRKPKDTTLVDFETARLDIWNYNDDYLQPQQLVNLANELRRSYTAVMNIADKNMVQLGSDTAENIILINEGNANIVLAVSNKGNRASGQWEGRSKNTASIINTQSGEITNIYRNQKLQPSASPNGKFVTWYNDVVKNYFAYNIETKKTTNISKSIKTILFDEENDVPDSPSPYGIMRWHQNDEWVYIFDKYDIYKCDPNGVIAPTLVSNGRKTNTIIRWQNTNADERFIKDESVYAFTLFNDKTKESGMHVSTMPLLKATNISANKAASYGRVLQAQTNANAFITTLETPQQAPHLISLSNINNTTDTYLAAGVKEEVIHTINPQQANYNWYTTELVKWKMFDGKISEGLLYKPENFDPKRKYPIIFYFYERDADNLYNYRGPAPSASTINIPYFTSNGYLVFDPNIYYKTAQPGDDSYNSVVSAAKYLTKTYSYVDSTKMAIQGQSWGGYQVAYLVTKTNIFAAAGAGAPVSNMTSAYGGIRWGTGISRQFQYEKGQSRIGKDLWNNTQAYLKNSPLFAAPKVKTPLLLMHNDKDGAVPWYQSIEYFTALKRLDKKVWLLQYNDEDHNLVERRNRKDLSIRLAQFFDHYLKGAPMPKWMSSGVPAIDKGIDWGF